VARPDVAKALDNRDLRSAGFQAAGRLDQVPGGRYELGLLLADADRPIGVVRTSVFVSLDA
jgi:hypothetical protein